MTALRSMVLAATAMAAGVAAAGTLQIETTSGNLTSLPGTDLVFTGVGGTRTVDLSSIPGYEGCSFDLTVFGLSNDYSELWRGDQGYGMRATPQSNYGPGIAGDRVGNVGAYYESVRLTIGNLVNLTDVRWNGLLFGDGEANGIELFDLASGEQVTLSGDATGTITGDGSGFRFAIPGNPIPTSGGLTAAAVNDGQSGWYLRGFAIDATAVPEPSTGALLAIAVGLAAGVRRAARKSTAD